MWNLPGKRFNSLRVSKKLGSSGDRHLCGEHGIAESKDANPAPESGEIVAICCTRCPHVDLQDALGGGRPLPHVVRSVPLGQFATTFQRSMVYRLRNVHVNLARLGGYEGNLALGKDVSKPLDTDADGPRAICRDGGVARQEVCLVDDLV